MQHTNRAPYTHGMEIEQFPAALPSRVREYTMSNSAGQVDGWHRDGSGPRETTLGPVKSVKAILDEFYVDTRDAGITWDWHAAHNGQGAGSHVHLAMTDNIADDEIVGWTISYNTCVELFPFLAPYFCHDWERGFRSGTQYHGSESNVRHWASPTLTRASQPTVRDHVANPTGYRRTYNSVTFNPQRSSKPVTIELRANDAHPAMALNGLLLLRRVAGRAVESGWSPKLENHRETLHAVYQKVYDRAHDVGLLTAMQEDIEGGITFQEDRGIPGVDRREFDTVFEVLRAIQRSCRQTSGSWKSRGTKLVAAGRDDYSPARNGEALWEIDAPEGEFSWPHGPKTAGEVDVETLAPDATLEDLEGIGSARADEFRARGIATPADLQDMSVERLCELPGVAENRAKAIRAQVDGVEFDAPAGGDARTEVEA